MIECVARRAYRLMRILRRCMRDACYRFACRRVDDVPAAAAASLGPLAVYIKQSGVHEVSLRGRRCGQPLLGTPVFLADYKPAISPLHDRKRLHGDAFDQFKSITSAYE